MSDNPHVFEVTQENFEEVVLAGSQGVPVLVDFWAEWCAPCRSLMPVLAGLAAEFNGAFILAKINSDEQQALASQYGVRSLPTVKVFHHGQVVDEFMGAQPESAIREILDRHIQRESDTLRLQGRGLLDAGQAEQALPILQQALERDPGNTRIHPDLAEALALVERYDEAKDVLMALPAEQRHEPVIKGFLSRLEFAGLSASAPSPADLEQRRGDGSIDAEGLYQLSAQHIVAGDYESALEVLIELIRKDRGYQDDAGRRGLLAVFDMLGGSGPLVNRYRGKLASLLN